MGKYISNPPADSFTAKKYAAESGMKYTAAKSRIAALRDKGLIELLGIGPDNIHYYRFKK